MEGFSDVEQPVLLKVFNSHFTSMEKWVISWSQVPQPLSFKNQKEVFFIENTPKKCDYSSCSHCLSNMGCEKSKSSSLNAQRSPVVPLDQQTSWLTRLQGVQGGEASSA